MAQRGTSWWRHTRQFSSATEIDIKACSLFCVELEVVIRKGRRQGEPGAHCFEFSLQEQRLGHCGRQLVRTLLQRCDFLRILCGNAILFGRILRDVIEFDSLRKRGTPDELPVALSLILADPQPHYDMEAYARNATKADPRFTGPIGVDGLYRKGELTHHGFGERLEGVPRVNAVKGTWPGDHMFVIDRLVLGLGEPAERWTLTFDGEKLNVRVKIPGRPETSIDNETGG